MRPRLTFFSGFLAVARIKPSDGRWRLMQRLLYGLFGISSSDLEMVYRGLKSSSVFPTLIPF